MESTTFETHGSVFESYVRGEHANGQLCAWRVSAPAGLPGMAHRPDRDEILLGLTGSLRITVDGAVTDLVPGEVVVFPAGAEVRLDGGPRGGSAWVTTTPGLTATTADGTVLAPPWGA